MKPPQILELEKHLGFELTETKNLDEVLGEKKSKTYLCNDMQEIIALNLSKCGLDNIDFLLSFTQLKYLNLHGNNMINISGLTNLTELIYLNFLESQIEYFESKWLMLMPNLKELYLWTNPIKNLPDFFKGDPKIGDQVTFTIEENPRTGKIQAERVRLLGFEDGNLMMQGTVKSFFNDKAFGFIIGNEGDYFFHMRQINCLPNLRNYFQELEKGKIINEKAKLIIVGNGRVGKTSLFKRLKGLEFDKDEKYTHGIQIGKLEKEHLQEVKTENLNVNVWDFGGQEIFYATHQFFLSVDAVYILAWTKEENVISHRERDKESLPTDEKWQSIDYWLDTIRRHAPKSPILVVQTHTDCGREKINEQDFAEFKISNFFNFSASKGFGLAEIQTELTERINALPMYAQEFPKTYEDVILQIENRKISGENWIFYHDFVNTICRNANITEGGEGTLLDYLDKTGLVVHYPQNPKLKEFIYSNPDWLTKQVYSLINNNLRATEGKITKEYLEKHLPDYETFGLLELFQKFGLLFESRDGNEIFWIAPQYLPEKRSEEFHQSIEDELLAFDLFIFRFARFMPDNVMINFIARYGNLSKKTYWKNGLKFTKIVDNQAVICIVVYRPENNHIEIYTSKIAEGKILLKEIVEAFSKFGKNAKTEISLDNLNFINFQKLKNAFEKDFSEIESLQGNRLEIKDFWFLFGKENTQTPKTAQQYFINDELQEALDTVLQHAKNQKDKDLENECTSTLGRLSGSEREKNKGTINQADYNIERNQIREATQRLIEQMKEKN